MPRINFTKPEMDVLVAETTRYAHFVGNRSMLNLKEKQSAWEDITMKINLVGDNNRSIEAVKARYQSYKKGKQPTNSGVVHHHGLPPVINQAQAPPPVINQAPPPGNIQAIQAAVNETSRDPSPEPVDEDDLVEDNLQYRQYLKVRNDREAKYLAEKEKREKLLHNLKMRVFKLKCQKLQRELNCTDSDIEDFLHGDDA